MIEVLKDMYNGHKIILENENGSKHGFATTIGLIQGSCLSPILFNYYLDKILQECPFLQMLIQGMKLLAYADDIFLICESEEELSVALIELEQGFAKYGLTLNKKKCEIFTNHALMKDAFDKLQFAPSVISQNEDGSHQ